MAQYGFLINLHRCIGCRTCTISCKMENSLAAGIQRIRVLNDDGKTTYDKPSGSYPDKLSFLWQPVPCQQCTNPACVAVCPTGARRKRDEDGIVVIDTDVCIGCGSCVEACPYEACTVDTDTNIADKCDMCLHRLEAGIPTTLCQISCPNRAIMVGDLEDPSSQIAQMIAANDTEQYLTDKGTGPNVFYWRSVNPSRESL